MTTSTTSDQTTPAKATKATKAKKATDDCAVQDCRRKPTHRGLCPAHWQTHRGLAAPKEESPDA